MKRTVAIARPENEVIGLDVANHGESAYPAHLGMD